MSASSPQLALYLPSSILAWQATDPGSRRKELDGALLFADITGFTSLVEGLSGTNRRGGEEVTEILNSVFTELLNIAREEGGDTLKFGGDAFLVLFEGEGALERASVAALDMQDALEEMDLEGISMTVGLDYGPVELYLAGRGHSELVVLGEALEGALEAEGRVADRGVGLGPGALERLPPHLVEAASATLVEAPDSEEPPMAARPVVGTVDLAEFVPETLRPHLTLGGALGEHRQTTVGFVHIDVAGFASENLGEALDDVITSVQEEAARHNVTFLGCDVDRQACKVILAAGVPVATRREEERVLRTLQRTLEHGSPLPLRAGVARGLVFAADVGAPFRRGYTVIGDTVNLAARLMGEAEPGQLLATRQVIDRSPTIFRVEQLEPVTLKGKSQPVAPVAVGPIIGVERVDRSAPLPMVGRAREREVIQRSVAEVVEGLGGVVEIVGEAGIGKSRLLSEARDLIPFESVYTLVCENYEINTPYYMAGHLMRGVLGLQADASLEVVEEALTERTREAAPELLPWLPLIATPLGLELAGTPTTSDISPAFRIDRMVEKVLELLAALIPAPAGFVVEDAHWIDPASFKILAGLAAHTERRPWLVLVGRRSEGTWTPVPTATILELEPLDADEVSELLRMAAREHPVSDHDLARVAERCGGHPLFALELLGGPDDRELPNSIEAVIAERIDRLDPRDRQVLRYAAVLGSSFTVDLLAEALPSVAHAVDDAETWQRLSDFLDFSVFGSVVFRHDLIQAVAYRGLPYRLRQEVHGVVAQAMERRARRRPERHASVLALHHHCAENWSESWRFSRMAAARASDSFATVEAAELYSQALKAADHLADVDPAEMMAAAEALGETAALAGRPKQALAAYERAEEEAPPGSIDSARLLRRKGALQINQGDFHTAVTWLETGLEILGDDESNEAAIERVELKLALAGTRHRLGNSETCAELCQEAMEEAERIGHRSGFAHAGFLMILTNLALGREDERDYGSQALEIYQDLGDLVGEGNTWNNLGMASYYRGDWDGAVTAWERSREARTRAGDAVGATTSINNLGEIYSDRGDLDRAAEMFQEALRGYEAAGFPTGVALATSNLGRVATRRGETETALESLAEARDLFAKVGAQSFVVETRLRIAEAHAHGGNFGRALEVLDELAADAGMPGTDAGAERIRGVAAWHGGDRDRAREYLEASVRLAQESKIPYEAALSLDLLATLVEDPEMRVRAATDLERLGASGAVRLPIPAVGR